MLTQATMGVLALSLGVLTIAGITRLWHVYVFAFLFGCCFCNRFSGTTDLRWGACW
jgi:hypothetical protein